MWCFLENNLWSTLSRHNTTTEVASFNRSICFQHHCAWARNIVNDYLLTAVISVNYDTLHLEMLVSLNYVAILALQEAWVFQTCSIEICFPCSPSSCPLLTKWSFQISLFCEGLRDLHIRMETFGVFEHCKGLCSSTFDPFFVQLLGICYFDTLIVSRTKQT